MTEFINILTDFFLYFTHYIRYYYLVQDRGSLGSLSLAEQYQASDDITRHNVQVSKELCKKAGHL